MFDIGQIKAAIFDLDDTIVHSNLDFAKIREDLGITKETDILAHLENSKSDNTYQSNLDIIHTHELNSANASKLFDGVEKFLTLLKNREIKLAILTRNSRYCTDMILKKHELVFDLVLTRDDVEKQKPDPYGIHKAMEHFNVSKEQVLWIGDSVMDVKTGVNAQVRTLHFNHRNRDSHEWASQFWHYEELLQVIS
jgi:HAD superfamily hydrolase (TIGR01549 family)